MSLHTFAAPSALSPQYVPLAQLAEYQTFNLGVAGSSPAWRTTKRILAKRDKSPVFYPPTHIHFLSLIGGACEAPPPLYAAHG